MVRDFSPQVTSLSLIIQYFDKFGSKHVAFSDLKPYVAQLGGSEQEDLVAQLRERCSGPPTSAAEIYRDINLRAVQRFCGGHRELTEDVAEAEVILEHALSESTCLVKTGCKLGGKMASCSTAHV